MSPSQDRKTFWRSRVLELQLPSEDTQNLLSTLNLVDPAHGLRAAMTSPLKQFVAQKSPALGAAFEAYEATLPKVGFFSFMPVMEVALRYLKAAQLVDPQRPYTESVNQFVYEGTLALKDAPFMQAFILASEHDPLQFFRAGSAQKNTVENYGERELELAQPGYVRFVCRRFYPLFAQYYIVGAMRGNLEWFGKQGEVSLEIFDDATCAVDVRW